MASRAERIADAVRTALSAVPMVSVEPQQVYRELRGALGADRLPAVAIELGNEPAPGRTTISHLMRSVEIRVTVLAAGPAGYGATDAAHVESFNRIAADATLGGLAFDMEEGAITREREDAERQRVSVTHTYLFKYRTTDRSIE